MRRLLITGAILIGLVGTANATPMGESWIKLLPATQIAAYRTAAKRMPADTINRLEIIAFFAGSEQSCGGSQLALLTIINLLTSDKLDFDNPDQKSITNAIISGVALNAAEGECDKVSATAARLMSFVMKSTN